MDFSVKAVFRVRTIFALSSPRAAAGPHDLYESRILVVAATSERQALAKVRRLVSDDTWAARHPSREIRSMTQTFVGLADAMEIEPKFDEHMVYYEYTDSRPELRLRSGRRKLVRKKTPR